MERHDRLMGRKRLTIFTILAVTAAAISGYTVHTSVWASCGRILAMGADERCLRSRFELDSTARPTYG